MVGVALIGSYARGDWGVGSDVDVLVVLDRCDEPPYARPLLLPVLSVPVGADVIVLAAAELDRLRAEGRRFARMVEEEAVWLWRREDPDQAEDEAR